MRKGIEVHDKYQPSDRCGEAQWNGTAITIAGGYVWEDVYKLAFPRNLTVVGGGDPVCFHFHQSPKLLELLLIPPLTDSWLHRRLHSRWWTLASQPRLRTSSRSDPGSPSTPGKWNHRHCKSMPELGPIFRNSRRRSWDLRHRHFSYYQNLLIEAGSRSIPHHLAPIRRSRPSP